MHISKYEAGIVPEVCLESFPVHFYTLLCVHALLVENRLRQDFLPHYNNKQLRKFDKILQNNSREGNFLKHGAAWKFDGFLAYTNLKNVIHIF